MFAPSFHPCMTCRKEREEGALLSQQRQQHRYQLTTTKIYSEIELCGRNSIDYIGLEKSLLGPF